MLFKVELAHIPPELSVYIGLFTEVQNAAFLRKQLLDGNTNFEFAFLNAGSILSTTHLLAAIFRAINDMGNNRMKSRNVHSEIVFAFSPNNNIAEAYRKFGISDDTRDLIVVKVTDLDPTGFQKLIDDTIQGQALELSDANLAACSDEASIRKIYKLPAPAKVDGKMPRGLESSLAARDDMQISILGLMALRGAT